MNPGHFDCHSLRLPGYDDARPGAYFVTIVAQDRKQLFGEVNQGNIYLNDAGQMVCRWWEELGRKFPNYDPGSFIVMPNHVHGIIYIVEIETVGADLRVCPDAGAHAGAPLPEMVQWFKTMTTNEYIRGVRSLGCVPFPDKLWQRNYYEHIVRESQSLNRLHDYIVNNPTNWSNDQENPKNPI